MGGTHILKVVRMLGEHTVIFLFLLTFIICFCTQRRCTVFLVDEPKRVCSAEKGMVFRVLSLEQGIPFHFLAS